MSQWCEALEHLLRRIARLPLVTCEVPPSGDGAGRRAEGMERNDRHLVASAQSDSLSHCCAIYRREDDRSLNPPALAEKTAGVPKLVPLVLHYTMTQVASLGSSALVPALRLTPHLDPEGGVVPELST
jgi:hypothetical protein